MLSLESPRWAELRHAYGPAADVPGMLKSLVSGDARQALDDLHGVVAHQGSATTSAYAAVPHVVAAAEALSVSDSLEHLHFVGVVASAVAPPQIPDDLRAAYHAALERGLALAVEGLDSRDTYEDAVAALQTVAALSGKPRAARRLVSLLNEAAELFCPSCNTHLEMDLAARPATLARHNISFGGASSLVVPWTVNAGLSRNADLAWMDEFVVRLGGHQGRLEAELAMLGGTGPCPNCGARIDIYEAWQA